MQGPIRQQITSDPARLAEVRGTVERISQALGFADETIGQLVLAIDEALCNVIKHAYGKEPGQAIDLTFAQRVGPPRTSLEVVVRDYGRQVPLPQIRSRPLEEIRPGGLGVHLIRAVMDEVEYTHLEDGGTRLRMRKYLPPEHQDAECSGGPA